MAKVVSARPPRGVDTSARHRRLKAIVQMAAIGAITVAAGFAVYAERATVLSGLKAFRHADLCWVLAGFVAESLSMTAFALLQRRMLLPAEARLTFGELMAIVYTSTAISLAVPVAGSGLATAYSHRRFRAGGADPAGVSMAMLMAGMISTVAFAVVVGAGGVVSGNPAAALAGVATSLLAAMAMGCLVVVLHSPGGRGRLRRPAVLVLELAQRLFGIVDIALIIALHAARLRTPDAVAAILWYRIITFKIGTTLLWMGYQYLRDRPRQGRWLKLRARS